MSLVYETFKNKLKANDRIEDCVITKLEKVGEDIFEARGHGVTILMFADTSDKLVIDPSHLGYDYEYLPRDESWGESCFRNDDENCEKFIKDVNRKMYQLALDLNELNYEVVLYCPCISGKGYGSGYDFDLDTEYDNYDKFIESNEYAERRFSYDCIVLFVFDLTHEKMKEYITQHENKDE